MAVKAECAPRRPHQLLAELSRPSLVFDHTQQRWASKLCVMSCRFLRHRLLRFVSTHADQTLCFAFCNDPTPMSLTARYQWGDDRDDEVIIRGGQKSSEFLVQRVWVSSLSGEASVCFAPPKRMADKTASAHMAGIRGLMSFPCELGIKGLNLSHGVWDRGIFSAQFRLFGQRHQQAVVQASAAMMPGEGRLLDLLSWCTGNACCDHDCHNALKRALSPDVDDKQFKKQLFKVFISVRSGFDLLAGNVWEWASTRVKFEDWGLERSQQEQLWRVLGVIPSWAEELVDLELRYMDGMLCVAKRHSSDPDIMRRIVRAEVRHWQLKAFTESRWLSLGPNARCMAASLMLGLDSLVSFCINEKGCSQYNLGNFVVDDRIRQFLLTCAVSSFVSETPLAIFFEDDRLVRLYDDILEELDIEVDCLYTVFPEVWKALAVVAGCSDEELRNRCIRSAHIQSAFLRWRLRECARLPWSLCRGDRMQNLLEFAEGPRPTSHGCSEKIWDLMQAKFDVELILDGLEMLSRVSWSSKRVEEGHVAGSRLNQLRKKFGEAAMVTRAQLGQLRALTTLSAEEKRLDKLNATISKLKRKNPNKKGAKQVFLGSLVKLLHSKKDAGLKVSVGATRKLVAGHGKTWLEMSDGYKRLWREKALQEQKDGRRQLADDLRAAMVRKASVEQECKMVVLDSPLKLSACRFTKHELQAFDAMWDDPELPNTRVNDLLADICRPWSLCLLMSIDSSVSSLCQAMRPAHASQLGQVWSPRGGTASRIAF